MRVGSLFSGIGAPEVAWSGLGWDFRWCAETDAFAAAVYAAHFPGVLNLGDVNDVDWDHVDPIDLLVFGPPCQSFSVAGNRAGLDDPRGILTLLGIRVAAKLKPRYVLWENVPGVLSDDDGQTIQAVVELFTRIGYVCDVDVRDAQYFGVPQRRRRVFVIGMRIDAVVQTVTPLSQRFMADLLAQALLATWGVMVAASGSDYSTFVSRVVQPNDSAGKMWQLDTLFGGSAVEALLGFWDMARSAAKPFWWETLWEALLVGNSVEREEVAVFARYSLDILQSVIERTGGAQWDEDHWNIAYTVLTLAQDIIDYARSTGAELWITRELRAGWRDNFNAACACGQLVERRVGNWAHSKEVLTLAESLRGDTAARGKTREGAARTIARRAPGGGVSRQDDRLLIAGTLGAQNTRHTTGLEGGYDLLVFGGNNRSGPIEVASALSAHGGSHGRLDFTVETFVAQRGDSVSDNEVADEIGDDAVDAVAYGIRSDASREGTALTPSPDAEGYVRLRDPGMGVYEDIAPTLDASQPHAVAFESRVARNGRGAPSDVAPPLKAQSGTSGRGDGAPLVATISPAVATITPILEAGARTGKSTDDPRAGIGIGEPDDPMFTLQPGKQHAVAFRENVRGEVEFVEGGVTQSLTGGGGKPGQGYPAVAYNITPSNSNKDYNARESDHAQAITTAGTRPSARGGDVVLDPPIAYGISSDATDRHGDGDGTAAGRSGLGIIPDATPAIRARRNNGVADEMAVRRLTPLECERLQGFPDGYTAIKYLGKPAPDGSRYRVLGNSMAVPVIRWLGERIERLDRVSRNVATIRGDAATTGGPSPLQGVSSAARQRAGDSSAARPPARRRRARSDKAAGRSP